MTSKNIINPYSSFTTRNVDIISGKKNVDEESINNYFNLILEGDITKLDKFLNNNYNVINALNNNSLDALHVIIDSDLSELNKLNLIKFLVSKKKFLETQNKLGETPLFISIKKNYLNIAIELLRAGANLNIKNSLNITPGHLLSRSTIIECKNTKVTNIIDEPLPKHDKKKISKLAEKITKTIFIEKLLKKEYIDNKKYIELTIGTNTPYLNDRLNKFFLHIKNAIKYQIENDTTTISKLKNDTLLSLNKIISDQTKSETDKKLDLIKIKSDFNSQLFSKLKDFDAKFITPIELSATFNEFDNEGIYIADKDDQEMLVHKSNVTYDNITPGLNNDEFKYFKINQEKTLNQFIINNIEENDLEINNLVESLQDYLLEITKEIGIGVKNSFNSLACFLLTRNFYEEINRLDKFIQLNPLTEEKTLDEVQPNNIYINTGYYNTKSDPEYSISMPVLNRDYVRTLPQIAENKSYVGFDDKFNLKDIKSNLTNNEPNGIFYPPKQHIRRYTETEFENNFKSSQPGTTPPLTDGVYKLNQSLSRVWRYQTLDNKRLNSFRYILHDNYFIKYKMDSITKLLKTEKLNLIKQEKHDEQDTYDHNIINEYKLETNTNDFVTQSVSIGGASEIKPKKNRQSQQNRQSLNNDNVVTIDLTKFNWRRNDKARQRIISFYDYKNDTRTYILQNDGFWNVNDKNIPKGTKPVTNIGVVTKDTDILANPNQVNIRNETYKSIIIPSEFNPILYGSDVPYPSRNIDHNSDLAFVRIQKQGDSKYNAINVSRHIINEANNFGDNRNQSMQNGLYYIFNNPTIYKNDLKDFYDNLLMINESSIPSNMQDYLGDDNNNPSELINFNVDPDYQLNLELKKLYGKYISFEIQYPIKIRPNVQHEIPINSVNNGAWGLRLFKIAHAFLNNNFPNPETSDYWWLNRMLWFNYTWNGNHRNTNDQLSNTRPSPPTYPTFKPPEDPIKKPSNPNYNKSATLANVDLPWGEKNLRDKKPEDKLPPPWIWPYRLALNQNQIMDIFTRKNKNIPDFENWNPFTDKNRVSLKAEHAWSNPANKKNLRFLYWLLDQGGNKNNNNIYTDDNNQRPRIIDYYYKRMDELKIQDPNGLIGTNGLIGLDTNNVNFTGLENNDLANQINHFEELQDNQTQYNRLINIPIIEGNWFNLRPSNNLNRISDDFGTDEPVPFDLVDQEFSDMMNENGYTREMLRKELSEYQITNYSSMQIDEPSGFIPITGPKKIDLGRGNININQNLNPDFKVAEQLSPLLNYTYILDRTFRNRYYYLYNIIRTNNTEQILPPNPLYSDITGNPPIGTTRQDWYEFMALPLIYFKARPMRNNFYNMDIGITENKRMSIGPWPANYPDTTGLLDVGTKAQYDRFRRSDYINTIVDPIGRSRFASAHTRYNTKPYKGELYFPGGIPNYNYPNTPNNTEEIVTGERNFHIWMLNNNNNDEQVYAKYLINFELPKFFLREEVVGFELNYDANNNNITNDPKFNLYNSVNYNEGKIGDVRGRTIPLPEYPPCLPSNVFKPPKLNDVIEDTNDLYNNHISPWVFGDNLRNGGYINGNINQNANWRQPNKLPHSNLFTLKKGLIYDIEYTRNRRFIPGIISNDNTLDNIYIPNNFDAPRGDYYTYQNVDNLVHGSEFNKIFNGTREDFFKFSSECAEQYGPCSKPNFQGVTDPIKNKIISERLNNMNASHLGGHNGNGYLRFNSIATPRKDYLRYPNWDGANGIKNAGEYENILRSINFNATTLNISEFVDNYYRSPIYLGQDVRFQHSVIKSPASLHGDNYFKPFFDVNFDHTNNFVDDNWEPGTMIPHDAYLTFSEFTFLKPGESLYLNDRVITANENEHVRIYFKKPNEELQILPEAELPTDYPNIDEIKYTNIRNVIINGDEEYTKLSQPIGVDNAETVVKLNSLQISKINNDINLKLLYNDNKIYEIGTGQYSVRFHTETLSRSHKLLKPVRCINWGNQEEAATVAANVMRATAATVAAITTAVNNAEIFTQTGFKNKNEQIDPIPPAPQENFMEFYLMDMIIDSNFDSLPTYSNLFNFFYNKYNLINSNQRPENMNLKNQYLQNEIVGSVLLEDEEGLSNYNLNIGANNPSTYYDINVTNDVLTGTPTGGVLIAKGNIIKIHIFGYFKVNNVDIGTNQFTVYFNRNINNIDAGSNGRYLVVLYPNAEKNKLYKSGIPLLPLASYIKEEEKQFWGKSDKERISGWRLITRPGYDKKKYKSASDKKLFLLPLLALVNEMNRIKLFILSTQKLDIKNHDETNKFINNFNRLIIRYLTTLNNYISNELKMNILNEVDEIIKTTSFYSKSNNLEQILYSSLINNKYTFKEIDDEKAKLFELISNFEGNLIDILKLLEKNKTYNLIYKKFNSESDVKIYDDGKFISEYVNLENLFDISKNHFPDNNLTDNDKNKYFRNFRNFLYPFYDKLDDIKMKGIEYNNYNTLTGANVSDMKFADVKYKPDLLPGYYFYTRYHILQEILLYIYSYYKDKYNDTNDPIVNAIKYIDEYIKSEVGELENKVKIPTILSIIGNIIDINLIEYIKKSINDAITLVVNENIKSGLNFSFTKQEKFDKELNFSIIDMEKDFGLDLANLDEVIIDALPDTGTIKEMLEKMINLSLYNNPVIDTGKKLFNLNKDYKKKLKYENNTQQIYYPSDFLSSQNSSPSCILIHSKEIYDILDKTTFNYDQKDHYGNTSIYYAIKTMNIYHISYLIKKKIWILDTKNNEKQNPIEYTFEILNNLYNFFIPKNSENTNIIKHINDYYKIGLKEDIIKIDNHENIMKNYDKLFMFYLFILNDNFFNNFRMIYDAKDIKKFLKSDQIEKDDDDGKKTEKYDKYYNNPLYEKLLKIIDTTKLKLEDDFETISSQNKSSEYKDKIDILDEEITKINKLKDLKIFKQSNPKYQNIEYNLDQKEKEKKELEKKLNKLTLGKLKKDKLSKKFFSGAKKVRNIITLIFNYIKFTKNQKINVRLVLNIMNQIINDNIYTKNSYFYHNVIQHGIKDIYEKYKDIIKLYSKQIKKDNLDELKKELDEIIKLMHIPIYKKILNKNNDKRNIDKNSELKKEYIRICFTIDIIVGSVFMKVLRRLLLSFLKYRYPSNKETNYKYFDILSKKIELMLTNVFKYIQPNIKITDYEPSPLTKMLVLLYNNYKSEDELSTQDEKEMFDYITNAIINNGIEKINDNDPILDYLRKKIIPYFVEYYRIAINKLINCINSYENYLLNQYYNLFIIKLLIEGQINYLN